MRSRALVHAVVRVLALALALLLATLLATVACSQLEIVGRVTAGSEVPAIEAGPLPNPIDSGPVEGRTTLDDCEAGDASTFGAETIAALMSGGGEGALRLLYPYDGTVFPGGLQSPLLMWGGPAGDVVYVRLHSESFDYRGCFAPTAPGQLQFPQRAWDLAQTVTAGAADPFVLELTVLTSGQVLGPVSERVVIAAGTFPGSVYYMTLGSTLGGAMTFGESSVVRLRPGKPLQLALGANGCSGCHSVSADGTRVVANASDMGASFTVSAAAGPTPLLDPTPGGEYAALVPDGALYLATAHPMGGGPRSYGASASMTATLYETATGNPVAGAGIPTGATMPSFSPNGTRLVFNDPAIVAGNGLALMDFSESSRKASNYRAVFSDTSRYAGWPTFLPDGSAVVFSLGAGSDYSGAGTGLGVITPGPATDLYIVDASSHTSTILARAMGFATPADAASGTTYLPFGSGDLHQNFDPAVSPGTSGGYAWVLFDSRRNYGNTGLPRAIWCAALDVSPAGQYTTDPSHPAFFLPGQESATANFRPEPALDP
jgi:hypothetical protein